MRKKLPCLAFCAIFILSPFFAHNANARDIYYKEKYDAKVENYTVTLMSVSLGGAEDSLDLDNSDQVTVHYGQNPPAANGMRYMEMSVSDPVTFSTLPKEKKKESVAQLYVGFRIEALPKEETARIFKLANLQFCDDRGNTSDGTVEIAVPEIYTREMYAKVPDRSDFFQPKDIVSIAVFKLSYPYAYKIKKIISLGGDLVLYNAIEKEEILISDISSKKEIEKETKSLKSKFKMEKIDLGGGKRKYAVYVKSESKEGREGFSLSDRGFYFSLVMRDADKKVYYPDSSHSGGSGEGHEMEYNFHVPASVTNAEYLYTVTRKTDASRTLHFEIKNIPVLEER